MVVQQLSFLFSITSVYIVFCNNSYLYCGEYISIYLFTLGFEIATKYVQQEYSIKTLSLSLLSDSFLYYRRFPIMICVACLIFLSYFSFPSFLTASCILASQCIGPLPHKLNHILISTECGVHAHIKEDVGGKFLSALVYYCHHHCLSSS